MCRAEAPHFSALQKAYEDQGFTVLAVESDNYALDRLKELIQSNGLTHRILRPGSRIAQLYSVRAFPTKFWIDRSGTIVDWHYGGQSRGEIESRLKQLLTAGGR